MRDSATGFKKVKAPFVSVVITPSPILKRVNPELFALL